MDQENGKIHHWERNGASGVVVSYAPLGAMVTLAQMLARAGSPVELTGVAYYNEQQGNGRVLGVADDANPDGKPALVIIDQEAPALPPDAHIIVRGRLAREPYSSAG